MKHIQTFKLFESNIADPTTNKNFVEWFGGSKLVDKNGKPMVWYHGTNEKFDEFSWSSFGQTDDGYYGRGFYFSNEPKEAREYGRNVMGVYLKVENPFWLKSDGSMGSAVLLDVRDDLARILDYAFLKTNRELPEGYHIKKRDDPQVGERIVSLAVWPDEKLWGTDKEIYGPDQSYRANDPDLTNGSAEIQAIVAFNDEAAGHDYSSGWTSELLKQIGRNDFTDKLSKAGYDGVFIVAARELGEKVGIENIDEVIIFNDYQIKSATDNSGVYDPKSNNILK